MPLPPIARRNSARNFSAKYSLSGGRISTLTAHKIVEDRVDAACRVAGESGDELAHGLRERVRRDFNVERAENVVQLQLFIPILPHPFQTQPLLIFFSFHIIAFVVVIVQVRDRCDVSLYKG